MLSGVLKYVLLFLIPLLCFSQNDSILNQRDFDNIARTKTYNGDLPLLVSQLTQNCTTQTEKARAIFVWITDNIAYDVIAYNTGHHYKRPVPRKGKDYNELVKQWEINYTDVVLRTKRAVCEGYSYLFQRMCSYANVETSYITGYTKRSPEDIGEMGSNNHAWNGIWLDNKYYFIDATWASVGSINYPDGKIKKFEKSFDNFYWLTPVEKFCIDHYPEDNANPGVLHYPIEKYKDNPYIRTDYIPSLEIITPKNGIIKMSLGQRIDIQFKSEKEIKTITINIKSKSDTQTQEGITVDFKKDENIYSFNYVIADPEANYVEIYFDRQMILSYKIELIN